MTGGTTFLAAKELSFVFKKAAEQAVRDFPAETKGYIFIDGDSDESIAVNNLRPEGALPDETLAAIMKKKAGAANRGRPGCYRDQGGTDCV